MPISILAWGGIGDTLRNISLIPHEALFRRFGIRSRVYYLDWRKTGALPPESAFFENLLSRVPSLHWCGESGTHTGTSRIINRGLREVVKTLHGNVPRYFPFEIPLTPSELAGLPQRPSGFVVGIQTHLSGMKTKQWGIENWHSFLKQLVAWDPNLSVFLIDSDPSVTGLCLNSRVQTTHGLTIAQSIHLVQSLDFLISVDSWTKYVAAWSGIPQLVIVPDQRSEYPGLTAIKLVNEEFAGIFGDPKNHIVGLRGTWREPKLSLEHLSLLTPECLLVQVQESIGRQGFKVGIR